MNKALRFIGGGLLIVALVAGCTANEPRRGGAGAPLYFTDFSEVSKTAAFSPKGDGNWTVNKVTSVSYTHLTLPTSDLV